MKYIGRYFKDWFYWVRGFRICRNTLFAVILICLLTLVLRYHYYDPANWISQKFHNLSPYRIPMIFLTHGLFYFFIPLLTVPLLAPSNRFGLRLGNVGTWAVDVAVAWLVLLVLILIFCRNPAFLNYYPIFKPAAYSWQMFLLFQACQVIYMLGWEFMFRGYLLFTAEKEIGAYPAIILQMLPFAYLHIGKPELETYGAVFAGLFLGIIALRANSFLPCAILHFSVAFTMDVFAIVNKMWYVLLWYIPLAKG